MLIITIITDKTSEITVSDLSFSSHTDEVMMAPGVSEFYTYITHRGVHGCSVLPSEQKAARVEY